MASGLTGSACLASANQAANSRSGSSASVKSPPVNPVGCSIEAASDILWGTKLLASRNRGACRQSLYNRPAPQRLPQALGWLVMLSTFLGACAGAGCSYPLSSLLSRNGTEPEATGSVPRPGSAAYAVDVQPPE